MPQIPLTVTALVHACLPCLLDPHHIISLLINEVPHNFAIDNEVFLHVCEHIYYVENSIGIAFGKEEM